MTRFATTTTTAAALLLCVTAALCVVSSCASPTRRDDGDNYAPATSIEHDDVCGDIRPQTGLVIQQMTGVWYGNELINHGDAELQTNWTKPATCIVVEITQETTTVRPQLVPYNEHPPTVRPIASWRTPTPSVFKKQLGADADHYDHDDHHHDPNDRHSYDYLRLIWDDNREEGVREYTLHYNRTSRGRWHTDADATAPGHYQSVRKTPPETSFLVMKAVGNHVVLTRCETVPRRRLQSITLSRATERLPDEELMSVQRLLQRRHLSIYSKQPLCINQKAGAIAVASASAQIIVASLTLSMILTGGAYKLMA